MAAITGTYIKYSVVGVETHGKPHPSAADVLAAGYVLHARMTEVPVDGPSKTTWIFKKGFFQLNMTSYDTEGSELVLDHWMSETPSYTAVSNGGGVSFSTYATTSTDYTHWLASGTTIATSGYWETPSWANEPLPAILEPEDELMTPDMRAAMKKMVEAFSGLKASTGEAVDALDDFKKAIPKHKLPGDSKAYHEAPLTQHRKIRFDDDEE